MIKNLLIRLFVIAFLIWVAMIIVYIFNPSIANAKGAAGSGARASSSISRSVTRPMPSVSKPTPSTKPVNSAIKKNMATGAVVGGVVSSVASSKSKASSSMDATGAILGTAAAVIIHNTPGRCEGINDTPSCPSDLNEHIMGDRN